MNRFDQARDRAQREAAHKHRLCQAAAIIKLFALARGCPPKTDSELAEYLSTEYSGPSPIDPYTVLTNSEIAQVA